MRWFKDLSVRYKLLAFGVSAVIFAVVIGAAGYLGILRSEEAMERVVTLSSALRHHQEIDMMHDALRGDVMVAMNAAANGGAKRSEIEADLTDHMETMQEMYTKNRALDLSDDIRQQLSATEPTVRTYIRESQRMVTLAFDDPKRAVRQLDEYLETFRELEKELGELSDVIQKRNAEAQQQGVESTVTAKQTIVITVLAVLVGIILASVFLAKLIGGPIVRLTADTERVASGDLTVEIHPESSDEIGRLSGAFSEMVTNLHRTISAVHDASAAVASASAQISSSTEQMSSGSQEQTIQAGQVASAVEEMAKTIIENSRNAGSTAETARQAKEAAINGGAVVKQTVEGMQRIAQVVNASAGTVRELGRSSDQIGTIINVINDIADQTNLLALNAAIEAARAGDQGRGFAVVADEVRKLAERTTKATMEIAKMIKQIQAETLGAVESMAEGTNRVAEGIALADRAGASLMEIVTVSQDVMDQVAQIASASTEQSSASELISKNVEAISAVTQQTATATQEIARTAEDLNRLTENLQQLVAQFVLSSKSGSAASVVRRPAPRAAAAGPASLVGDLAFREN